jgi:hypothetical protein
MTSIHVDRAAYEWSIEVCEQREDGDCSSPNITPKRAVPFFERIGVISFYPPR